MTKNKCKKENRHLWICNGDNEVEGDFDVLELEITCQRCGATIGLRD